MDLLETEHRKKARRLIENIAQENTLHGTIFGTQLEVVINNCLEILSNQLYEKNTHFLLELIQNADDNTYTCSTPTLRFSYKPGYLRIDCNETGFDASHVAAICGISQSTKSGKSSDGEFIGEKGIGFKSVFKAADIVWIASNDFTFKFDRTKPLGVITPLWEEFPEKTESFGTSILLRLADSYDERILVRELHRFDTNLLVFLRRVAKINIEVCCDNTDLWKKKIWRTQEEQDFDRLVVLHTDGASLKYLIRTHIIRKLPHEVKRRGWSETNIVLAFPMLSGKEKPRLDPQNVYAFLPIRNYGFSFLVQGDFILTASREDIESTLPWNLRIRDALPEAFLSSMLHFNKGVLKYVWPFYLPSLSGSIPGIFDPAIETILAQIRESPVLESSAGNMVRPSTLVHVPAEFCVNGKPFTLCDQTKDHYLSTNYASWVIDAMESVGVSQLTPRKFLEDLATLIAIDTESFHRKSSEWHSQLAMTLLRLSTDADLMPLIQDLALIPIDNGHWTAARDNSIFFPKNDSSLEIPDGLPVLIVDSKADSDLTRRNLFSTLGVKAWEAPEICRLILSVHTAADFQPEQLSTAQITSHTKFMYHAKWQPPKDADLWFATSRNGRFRGREVYIPGNPKADPATARVLAILERQFPVIHHDYLTAMVGDSAWLDWLVQNLGLSKIPRLVTPVVEPRAQPIEPDTESGSPSHTLVESALLDHESPPKRTEEKMAKTMDSDNDILDHSSPLFEGQNSETEAFPAFDLGQEPGSEAEPFPSFDGTKMQKNAIGPSYPIPTHEQSRFNRVRRTTTRACEQCRMGTGILKCDEKRPVCGACTRHQLHCVYAHDSGWRPLTGFRRNSQEESQDIGDSFSQRSGGRWDPPPVEYSPYSIQDNPTTQNAQDGTPRDVNEEQRNKPNLYEHPTVEIAETKELLFDLSDEFKYIFNECDTGDIFQLIRDNWHHYSQWIEGPHMKWQSQDYVFSGWQLRDKIGACIVQTSLGSLPLHDTVLAKLDDQMDESNAAPALRIHEPETSEWSSLGHFGVVVKNDVSYYLRCLMTIAGNENPDIDVISYIYEQIQTKYTGNEGLVRAAFYSKDIIWIHPKTQASDVEPYWTNMERCLIEKIDLSSSFTNCSYLFRCLLSPSGDPIGGLVHTMTMISSSSSLRDIARLFREISRMLDDVNSSKSSLLLKPLQNKAIFPLSHESGHSGYGALTTMHDKSWFIADNPNLVASFTGVVPLLAFSVRDISEVENLFRALRLDDRKISNKVTSQTRAIGRTRSDIHYTDKFRSKVPFLKALVPQNHPKKATIVRQITKLRVYIATGVVQTFTMALPNKEIQGKSIPGHAFLTSTDDTMTLWMTEETATADYPSHELVNMLGLACGIKEQQHITLLLIALGNSSTRSIATAFLQQGIEVKGISPDEPEEGADPLDSFEGVGEVDMPAMTTENMKRAINGGLDLHDGVRFEAAENGDDDSFHDPDTRIPMLIRIKGNGNTYSKIPLSQLERKEDEFIDCDHMQFLGENMVARLLDVHLGSSFDPIRDWTSDLRERAGFTYVPEDSSVAPFTLAQAEASRRMTDFVVQFGTSRTEDWRERLKTSTPTYHVDVLVSGDSRGRFVMEAKWLERTIKLRMPIEGEIQHVNVLIHMTQAYSQVNLRFDVIVDPWHLVQSGELEFSKNWLMQGSLGIRYADNSVQMFPSEVEDPSLIEGVEAAANKNTQLVLYNELGRTTEPNRVRKADNDDRQPMSTLYLPWSGAEATDNLQFDGSASHTTFKRNIYTYKPLLRGYIRLLYLLPGASGAPVQALLNHIACNYAGTYQALSYVWGADARDEDLVTPDGIIPITTSLHKALVALRQKDQAVMVWVDAVCINQADTKEKAQQIRLMPEIYQACECTYAFLSEGSAATDQALDMIMQVRARVDREKHQRFKGRDADKIVLPHVMSTWEGNRLPPGDSPMWSSIKALFASSYFRRAWIIQEIVVAPKVKFVCGEWLVDMKDLYAGLEALDREVQMMDYDEGFSDIQSSWEPFTKLALQRQWEARHHRWSLFMLLEQFRYTESALSRDRLFALVGLASDGNEADFEPDYESDFQNIVIRFAQAFVRQGRGIQLLYRAGISASEDSNKQPSWIPDWTQKRSKGLHDSSDTDRTFSACGPEPPLLKLGPEPGELSVDGYDMDTILTITSASNNESEWFTYFAEIDSMIDEGVLSDTMGPKERLKWTVPIAAAPYPNAESFAAFRNYLDTSTHISTTNLHGIRSDAYKTYTACLRGTLAGWKFVVTKRGFAGVVPSLTSVGDEVAIVKGGCVPFILRKNEERWRLVGECYIHGFMKGEGLWLPGIQEKTFCLY